MKAMEGHLEEALDAGMMGLSGMTNPWDKLDGDRERSASLPSSYAPWWELRRLNRILRRRDKVLQSAPNLVTKYNALLFGITSAGWFFRKKLKTTLITLMAVKGQESLPRLAGFLANFFNRFFRADFRWESLPTQFEVFSDGIDLVIFEEFGAGEAVLHLADELQRNELMRDPEYRKRFRKDYEKRFGARVWHRDLGDTNIVEAPDASLVGKSFADVAAERGVHEVDAFLDLVVEHGRKLRLVADAQEQARPDFHHAVRRHRRVEIGRADDVDADVLALVAGDPAEDLVHIGVEAGIANDEVRSLQLPLIFVHYHPQAALVLVLGLVAADRLRAGRRGQQRQRNGRSDRLPDHDASASPALVGISRNRLSTVERAPSGLRMSPTEEESMLNQTMSPVSSSTRLT